MIGTVTACEARQHRGCFDLASAPFGDATAGGWWQERFFNSAEPVHLCLKRLVVGQESMRRFDVWKTD